MTDINADAWVSSNHRPMRFPEFVIMIASIMALNPLAMDMMLPALPSIGSAFHIADQIAMLHHGVIVAQGTPAELRNCQEPHTKEFLSTWFGRV